MGRPMNRREREQARMLDGYLTVKKAAELLGVRKEAIIDRIRRGTIQPLVVDRALDGTPRYYLVPKSQVLTRRRPGRPKGWRAADRPAADASLPDTDFLEEAAAALPDEVPSGGGIGTRGTRRSGGSPRGAGEDA